MMPALKSLALPAALIAAALVLPVLHGGETISWRHAAALAQAQAEKDAFEQAKALGTVEAWDAFLSHYPGGFYADLARAYVKKLAEQPDSPRAQEPEQAGTAGFDYPMVAGSWGGIVRSGPGQDNAKVASLKEGEEVTLMGPPVPVNPNDYPWFKIAFRNGQTGYMWGGLLCSTGAERPDLFKLCTFTPVRVETSAPQARPAKRAAGSNGPSWCASPRIAAEAAICGDADLLSLDGVLNVAYRRAKGDSPGSIAAIDHEHKRWIGRRNACGGDTACLRRRYNEQIPFLEGFFGN
jgi:hypothetical protein